MSINKVIISGNLTRDPEVRVAGTQPLCQIGVAVNDRRKNNDTGEWVDSPNFFDVLIWGSRGEYWARHLSKGSKVVISGRLRWSSWTGADGQKKSKVEIVADDIEGLSAASKKKVEASADVPATRDSIEILENEIPF